MYRKLSGFHWFFVIILGGLLLTACAPGTNSPAQQVKNDRRAEAQTQPEAANHNKAKSVLSSRLEASASTALNQNSSITIVGSEEKQSSVSWVAGGKTVQLQEAAQIQGSPRPQSIVDVKGSLGTDGNLLADQITISDLATVSTQAITSTGNFEIVGMVTSILTDTWSIGAQAVQVDTSTEIHPGLGVGSEVKVEGCILSDGAYLAREISLATQGVEEVEFTGLLTAMNGNTWTVNQILVTITTTTNIKGDPQIGDFLKVEGKAQLDGSVLAHEIQVKKNEHPGATQTPQAGHDVEFAGIVNAINGSTWVIDGVTIVVTLETEISGNPQVGDTVKVEGYQQADGTILAYEIDQKTETPGVGDDADCGDGTDDDCGDSTDDDCGSGTDGDCGSSKGNDTGHGKGNKDGGNDDCGDDDCEDDD